MKLSEAEWSVLDALWEKKEACARQEREELCSKVYGGATGEMLAAFLKESTISKEEINRLKKLLDEMEV